MIGSLCVTGNGKVYHRNSRRERERERDDNTHITTALHYDGWLLSNEIILGIFSCFHQFILIGDLNLKES